MSKNQAKCPLCQEPNQCGVVMGKSDCWCFQLVLDPEKRAQLLPLEKDQACICPTCLQEKKQ